MTLDNSNNGKDGESRTIDSWRGVFDHIQNDMVMRVEKKKTLEETIKKEIEEQQRSSKILSKSNFLLKAKYEEEF